MAQADLSPDGSPGLPTSPADAGPRVLVERPDPGLAQGSYPWPAWGIGILGGTLVLATTFYLLVRYRSAYRGRNRRR